MNEKRSEGGLCRRLYGSLLWSNERADSRLNGSVEADWTTEEQSISIQDEKINSYLKMLAVDKPQACAI